MTGRTIRVGVTEEHGMTAEAAAFPPDGVEYRFLTPERVGSALFTSPIKGFMSRFDPSGCDIVEAVMSPIYTSAPWVLSLACLDEALAFGLAGVPVPRTVRAWLLRGLVGRPNCHRLVFWSRAGLRSVEKFPLLNTPALRRKCTVVYPAVRRVDQAGERHDRRTVKLLFSGDFFRKGGVNVVDAFERVAETHPDVTLTVCSDERLDFNTADADLRRTYLEKLRTHPRIVFGRIPREEMVERVLPDTDIYLLPTYQEAFGFAILEAMAFGIPVIATNIMAVPELVEDGRSGLLVDTSRFDCDALFRGYVVNRIPEDLRRTVTDGVYTHLVRLVESPVLRREMGRLAVERARREFSFETRNRAMRRIYEDACAAADTQRNGVA